MSCRIEGHLQRAHSTKAYRNRPYTIEARMQRDPPEGHLQKPARVEGRLCKR